VVLFIFNIIFFIAGAAILGVGLWVKFDKNFENIASVTVIGNVASLLNTAAYVLIAFGAIIFVVGFCGCCGAIKESKCLIGVYLAFIVVVIAGELAGGIYGYVKYEAVIQSLGETLNKSLEAYDANGVSNENRGWNFLMVKFECCGWNDTSLIESNKCQACSYNGDRNAYYFGQNLTAACDETEARKKKTCYTALKNFVESNTVILLAVAGGIAGLEILVFVMGLCFCCGIGKD